MFLNCKAHSSVFLVNTYGKTPELFVENPAISNIMYPLGILIKSVGAKCTIPFAEIVTFDLLPLIKMNGFNFGIVETAIIVRHCHLIL